MSTAILERLPVDYADEADYMSAEGAYKTILECRTAVDRAIPDWSVWGATPPKLLSVEEFEEKDYVAVCDLSRQPGGAFKYLSAAAALATEGNEVERVYTGSAGNYSTALGEACLRKDVKLTAYTPADLSDAKREAMVALGIDIKAEYPDVAEANRMAREDSKNDPNGAYLHPYDNKHGIAGLTVLTDDVLRQLYEAHYTGVVDLLGSNVEFLVQRGGGSLVSAVATAVHRAKRNGEELARNMAVVDVRPQRLTDGSLDPFYDGLRVEQPGSYAAALLGDRAFVERSVKVSEESVAKAARLIGQRTVTPYESNAMVGLAAAYELRPERERTDGRPTVYVSLLSGRNTSPQQQAELTSLPTGDDFTQPQTSTSHSKVWQGGFVRP